MGATNQEIEELGSGGERQPREQKKTLKLYCAQRKFKKILHLSKKNLLEIIKKQGTYAKRH